MKSNTRRYALIALCVLALLYIGKMMIGVVGFARYQDVPVVAACFELTMFVGAAVIPLTHALRHQQGRRGWFLVLWTPCILYVIGIGIDLLVRSDVDLRFVFAVARLAGWLAIATLFIGEVRRQKEPEEAFGTEN